MLNDYRQSWDLFPKYPEILNTLIEASSKRSSTEWKQNLYYYWLYGLVSILDMKKNENLPFFMQTEGWERKSLNTAMASWSELRHDTILYAKQSMTAECGGDGEEIKLWVPEPPKGYVEPNLEFYNRMISLMKHTKDELHVRKMLNPKISSISEQFIDLVVFLRKISLKELNNEKISLEEYAQIQKVGSLLDNLTLSVLTDNYATWADFQGPDKNMPVIADIHTADASVLEIGVGKAQEIYVIVNIEGKLKLTRGAIFSYYEFWHPASDRLTDEKWQEMVNIGHAPMQPDWINYKSNETKSKNIKPLYMPQEGLPKSSTEPGWKMIYYDTGC
jgi:hypothetical protein